MTRDEYNAKLQEVQAMWPGASCRVKPSYHRETLMASYFQVYWDGQWHTLGTQTLPFDADSTYQWNEIMELGLRGAFANSLMHS